MMENIFLRLLNMSLTAAVLVVVVVLLRAVFHKAPRWLHCLLWVLVAVRLVCPFTIESDLSLMPSTPAVTVPERLEASTPDTTPDRPSTEVIFPDDPAVSLPTDTPVGGTVTTPVTPTLPDSSVAAPGDSVDPWQVALAVATQVWLLGVLAMAVYAVVTTLRLRRQVREAARLEGNIWQCDHIRTPFILGVFRPRIYLPSDLSAATRDSVVAHEKAHLHRLDHLWKPFGFLLLAVYWFNPILWVAYILLCRDIEAACDERVIRHMSAADRKAYSEALLCCSAPRRLVSACPLAFGETGIKSRIRSVLSYKKPTVWILVAALLVSTVAGVCLLTDRPVAEQEPDDPPAVTDEDGVSKYATFLHTGEPQAQVQLELNGNGCTYINSILSSQMAWEGTYTMGESSVTLSFPNDAMTIRFDGDFTGLTFRTSGSRMSYDQVSFGDVELKNGAVFKRVADTRAVSFTTPHTISSMSWMAQEKQTAMWQRYSYRTGTDADIELPIIPITSRAELDAFVAEYGSEMTFPALSYDDAFFADKMLAAVYYTNASCSVKPQIAAVEYNGAELVTLQVDVYEPGALDDALGQWFMLAEIPRSEIPYATRFRAVERHHIPTDYYFATYSHPILLGSDEPTMGWSRLEYPMVEFRQLVDRQTWYGADIMADTAFTALGYFTFDGEKKYYVSPDGKQLYDGEQIADLTAADAEWLDYYFREGAPVDAATASVTGMVTEWNKAEGYLVLEVTDGDSKLGARVRAYTSILTPGSAPAVGYAATVYYDGWYERDGDVSVVYALVRKWVDADLLGGPDDDEPTSTTPPTTTTIPPTSAPATTAKVTFVKFSRPADTPSAYYSYAQYMYPTQPDEATCDWLRQLASRTNWVKRDTWSGAYDAYFTIGDDEEYYYIDRVNQRLFHNRRFLSLTKEETSKLDALIRSYGIQLNSQVVCTLQDWTYVSGMVEEYVGGDDGYVLLQVDAPYTNRFGDTVKVATRFIPHKAVAVGAPLCVVYDGELKNPETRPHTIYAAAMDEMRTDTIIATGVPQYDALLEEIQTYFYDRSAAKPDCSPVIWECRALSKVGIKLVDLDKNGQNELFIAGFDTQNHTYSFVYDMYTIKGGKLIHVFSGTEDSYYYMEKGGYFCTKWNDSVGTAVVDGVDYYQYKSGKLEFIERVICDREYANALGFAADDARFRTDKQEYDTSTYEHITKEEDDAIRKKYDSNDVTYTFRCIPFSL